MGVVSGYDINTNRFQNSAEEYMKYIVIEKKKPVLFSAFMKHSDFDNKGLGKITSAGFVLIEQYKGTYKVTTYGESSSLNLRPDSKDSKLILDIL